MAGNHDCGGDSDFAYYLANGVSRALQYSWSIDKGGFRYAFVAVTSAHNGGDRGYVTQETFDWTRGQFEFLAPCAMHLFLFAHHNSTLIPDAGFLGTGGLLDEYDVTSFVAGHHHIDFEETIDGIRFVTTAHQYAGMPDSDDGWMRIFVLTGAAWAEKPTYVVDRGPQVIIVSPQDKRLAAPRNPAGHVVSGPTPVTAMAFAEGDVSLDMSVDTLAPVPMTTADGRTFKAAFDFSQVAPGLHTIRVEDPSRVDDTNGIDQITVERSTEM
jgi:hypothetical protein